MSSQQGTQLSTQDMKASIDQFSQRAAVKLIDESIDQLQQKLNDPKEFEKLKRLVVFSAKEQNYIRVLSEVFESFLETKMYKEKDIWHLHKRYDKVIDASNANAVEISYADTERNHIIEMRKELNKDFKEFEIESRLRQLVLGQKFLKLLFEQEPHEDLQLLCYKALVHANPNSQRDVKTHKIDLFAACCLFATDLVYYCDFPINNTESVIYSVDSSLLTPIKLKQHKALDKTIFSSLPDSHYIYSDCDSRSTHENAKFVAILDFASRRALDIAYFKQKCNIYDVNEVKHFFKNDEMKVFLHKFRIFELDFTYDQIKKIHQMLDEFPYNKENFREFVSHQDPVMLSFDILSSILTRKREQHLMNI